MILEIEFDLWHAFLDDFHDLEQNSSAISSNLAEALVALGVLISGGKAWHDASSVGLLVLFLASWLGLSLGDSTQMLLLKPHCYNGHPSVLAHTLPSDLP